MFVVLLVCCFENSLGEINKLFDVGVYGVICLLINMVVDVECFVCVCYYLLCGGCSYGLVCGFLYGGVDYFVYVNVIILILVMIEICEGYVNVEVIL